jgi:hypothetical protein
MVDALRAAIDGVLGSQFGRAGIAHHRVHSKPSEPMIMNGHYPMVGDAP